MVKLFLPGLFVFQLPSNVESAFGECTHDVHWHFFRTDLNNVFRWYGVQGILDAPLDETLPDQDLLHHLMHHGHGANPWTHIGKLLIFLDEWGVHQDTSCPFGRWAGVALSCALFPDANSYVGVLAPLRRYLSQAATTPLIFTESGWPIWALLDLAIRRCRLKGVQIYGRPIMLAAWGPVLPPNMTRNNGSFPSSVVSRTALADKLGIAARLLLQVPLHKEHGPSADLGGFGLNSSEKSVLVQVGELLASELTEEGGLEAASSVVAAGASLWQWLAMLQNLRFLQADCPADSMLTSTRDSPITPPYRLCVRYGRHHPIDHFIWNVGYFPDCEQLLAAVGPPDVFGVDFAVDVGANIGACAIPLGLLGYRVVAFEPQTVESTMLEASALSNGLALHVEEPQFSVVRSLVTNTTGPRRVLQSHFAKEFSEAEESEPMWVGMMARPLAAAEASPLDLQVMGMTAVSQHSVESVRLDDFAARRPDLFPNKRGLRVLKIDAEHAEAEVLAGAASLLRAGAASARHEHATGLLSDQLLPRPLVLFEYMPRELELLGIDPLGSLHLLDSFGYAVASVKADGPQQQVIPPHSFAHFA
ncbi:unnamed protein product [Polarella glacialis]|uniref:Methyltransferase FkbM domain-containing protein n=1 Tax=Polarella glacialis TaxID=89957 RepID=A0A813DNS1_POLGL|nr:unnamed protein product [Polarella glacialis]